MSQVLKSQETIITLIITDSAGAFVTGLAPADVTLHFRKAGGIVTAKALDAENFVEIDATEMPGLYEVTFSSSELDTLGEFVAILKQGGATEFDNQTVRLEVVDTSTDLLSENVTSLFTSLDTTTSHIKQGEAYSLPIKLDTTGLLPADVTVTALKGDGTTATITLDGTNWEEVAGLTAVYRLTLPVGMTDTLGELVLYITSPGTTTLETVTVTSAAPGAATYDDLYAAHVKNEDEMWMTGHDSGGVGSVLLESTDGGNTFQFVDISYSSPLISVDGLEDGTDYIVYLGTLGGGRLYSVTNGTTVLWDDSTEIQNMYDVHAYASDSVWVAGNYISNGVLLLRKDNLSFTVESPNNFNGPFLAVRQVTDTRVWAVGEPGIYEGTFDTEWSFSNVTSTFSDAGSPFDGLSVDFSEDMGAILFGNSAGENLAVFITEDEGDNWTEVTLPSELDPTFEAAPDYVGNNIRVVGDSGIWIFLSGLLDSVQYDKVWISEDKGVTWTSETFGADDITEGDVVSSTGGRFALVSGTLGSANSYHRIDADLLTEAGEDLADIQVQVIEETSAGLKGSLATLDDKTTSHIGVDSSHTFPVWVTNQGEPVDNVVMGDLTITVVRRQLQGGDDGVDSITEAQFWQSVTGIPGLYRLIVPATIIDRTGEMLIRIEGENLDTKEIQVQVVNEFGLQSFLKLGEIESVQDTLLKEVTNGNSSTIEMLRLLKEQDITMSSKVEIGSNHLAVVNIHAFGTPSTGVLASEVTPRFLKADGTVVTFDPSGSWTEIDVNDLPGFYSFEIPVSLTDVEGDLFLVFKYSLAEAGWFSSTEVSTSSAAPEPVLNAISFVDEDRGWVAGGQNPNEDLAVVGDAVLLETTDGGTTWESSTTFNERNELTSIDAKREVDVDIGGGNIISFNIVAAATKVSGGNTYVHYFNSFGGGWSSIDITGVSTSISDVSIQLSQGGNYVWAVGGGSIAFVDTNGPTTYIQNTASLTGPFNGVYAFSEFASADLQSVWVVGDGGDVVEYQHNTGTDWYVFDRTSTISAAGANLNDVDFDETNTHGWIVGAGGFAAKTSNGGTSWSSVTTGTSVELSSVQVLSETEVWIYGAGGLVKFTDDGGTSWINRTFGEEVDFLNGAATSDTNTFTVAADTDIYFYGEDVVEDQKTYRYQVVSAETEVDLTPVINRIQLADDKTTSHIKQGEPYTFPVRIKLEGKVPSAEILASELSLKIIKGDGSMSEGMSNTTWSLIDIETGLYTLTIGAEITDQEGELLLVLDPAAEKATERLFDDGDSIGPLFLDETTGQIWNSDSETGAGNIWTSDDDGETWQLQDDSETGFFAYMDGAYIGEDLHIFGMTSYNEDVWIWDGSNWTTGTLDGNGNGLHAYGEGQVWFVSQIGSEGRLEVWDNGFQTEYSQAGTPFNSVHQSSPTKLWVGGGGGALWEGTLSEGSWSFVDRSSDIATTSIIRSLEFIDEDNGWFGTADPEMYKTTDGGQTWVETTTAPDIFEAQHIVIISPDDIITYSGNGDISRTTNGGETWADPNLPFTIQGSYFWGEGYIVGGDGVETNFILTQSVEGKALDSQDIQVQVIENTSKDVLDDLNTVKGVGFTSGEDDLKSLKAAITAGGVDLSPVIDILTEIKGDEFTAEEDDLASIREAVAAVSGDIDFTTVEEALDAIKGDGFVEGTDSLEQIRVKLITAQESLDDAATLLARIAGLSQENFQIVDQSYNEDSKLISATINTYAEPWAGSVPGVGDDPMATYELSATYNVDGLLTNYLVKKLD